jgi:Domain of unknown function (DUF4136)
LKTYDEEQEDSLPMLNAFYSAEKRISRDRAILKHSGNNFIARRPDRRGRTLISNVPLILAMLLLGSTGLFGKKVSIKYDKAVDFSMFKTYAWVTGTPAVWAAVDLYITKAADEMMQRKRMKRVEPKEADVLITYDAAVNADVNVSGFDDPTYARTGGEPLPGQTPWSGPSTGGMGARLIRKGSLEFQILNRSTHKVAWTGTASGTLKDSQPDRLDQLDKALTEIFAQYPPKRK